MENPDTGRHAHLERARQARREKLINRIDPDGTLAATDPDELGRRVAQAVSDQYAAMARAKHASARARKEAMEAATIAAEALLRAAARVGAA